MGIIKEIKEGIEELRSYDLSSFASNPSSEMDQVRRGVEALEKYYIPTLQQQTSKQKSNVKVKKVIKK